MILNLTLTMVVVATLLMVYRLFKGPSLADRVVAFDGMSVNVLIFILLMGMKLETDVFLDVAILLAVLSFIGTVAIAKYLHGGAIIDGRRS